MSGRGDAAGIALGAWLALFRVVLGLALVVGGGLAFGSNTEPLMPLPLGIGSALIELLCGLAITVGMSTRYFVAAAALQLAAGLALTWVRSRVSPIDVPNTGWLVVCLAVVGAFGAGPLSVDRHRPRWLPLLLLKLKDR